MDQTLSRCILSSRIMRNKCLWSIFDEHNKVPRGVRGWHHWLRVADACLQIQLECSPWPDLAYTLPWKGLKTLAFLVLGLLLCGPHASRLHASSADSSFLHMTQWIRLRHLESVFPWLFSMTSYFLKKLCIFGCAGFLLLHRPFSSCSKQGLLSSLVLRLLIEVASLVAARRI